MANGPRVVARRDKDRERVRPEYMTRLQQIGSGADTLTFTDVAGEVRLYRIVRRRHGGHKQQASNADEKQEVEASPWRA
jgi:hypothetical protein